MLGGERHERETVEGVTALNLDPWCDEPVYQAASTTFSERGAFILGKLHDRDAAKLQDVLADVYRDAIPDPMEWR